MSRLIKILSKGKEKEEELGESSGYIYIYIYIYIYYIDSKYCLKGIMRIKSLENFKIYITFVTV